MTDSTIALFCCLDDCARLVEDWERHHLIPSNRQRRRAGKLSLGEMLSIMVLFHISAYKAFKPFRLYGLSQEYGDCFGELPSHSRFVSLKPRLLLPFYLFTCCCIISVGRGPASALTTVPSWRSATMHPSAGTGFSKGWPSVVVPPWAGSWASSSICSSITRAGSWPSGLRMEAETTANRLRI